MKKPQLIVSLSCLIAMLPCAAAHAQIWAYHFYSNGIEHDCDAPVDAGGIHADHGNYGCGNTDTASNVSGLAETCTSTATTPSGHLTAGQWLTCNQTAGPGGSQGCDFQIVTYCGGTQRSGEIIEGSNPDGSYPACFQMQMTNAHGVVCGREDSSGRTTFQECYCDDSRGTWYCP